jgi:cyclohexyl-isocyanide hydratase
VQVNIIVVKDMVQLDITGPFEVLARTPGWNVDLIATSMEPVRTDRGLTILPTQTRETAKPSDILVVPGGTGIDYAMLDPSWIAYTRREADRAKYVSVSARALYFSRRQGLCTDEEPVRTGRHGTCSRSSA